MVRCLIKSEEEVVQSARHHLLRARPELWVRPAVHGYETEGLSVAKAASLADVSWAQMRDILLEHHVRPRLGAETLAEAEQDGQTLRAYLQEHP